MIQPCYRRRFQNPTRCTCCVRGHILPLPWLLAQVHRIKATIVGVVEKRFQRWVRFNQRGVPRFEFARREHLGCHEDSDRVRDDLLRGVWEIPERHDFLALLHTVKQ